MGNVFNAGGDGVPGGEWRIYDNTKVFYLEVGLIQGLEWASIIKVVVERDSDMGVYDGSD